MDELEADAVKTSAGYWQGFHTLRYCAYCDILRCSTEFNENVKTEYVNNWIFNTEFHPLLTLETINLLC